MEKQRKIKTIAVIALIVAVFGLTVAFAALSTTLSINGSAKVNAGSWEIYFDNLSSASINGYASVITDPEISSSKTEIEDYKVVLTSPGDSVSYTFDVVNNGTISAKIDSLTKTSPTCESLAYPEVTSDAEIVCSNLVYTLTYLDTGDEVKVGDTLDASETKTLKLTLSYSNSSSQIPTDDVKITGLDITFVYVQN